METNQTPEPPEMLDRAGHACAAAVDPLLRDCQSLDDGLAIAAVLVNAAEKILLIIGGREKAAQFFYQTADRLAGPPA